MITSSFHKITNLIGINVEKTVNNQFIVTVAFIKNGLWNAKTLGGISGDIDNELLIKKVIEKGETLDRKSAELIFFNSKDEYGKYVTD